MQKWLIFLLLIGSMQLEAQSNYTLQKEINLKFKIDHSAIDVLGNLYLSDATGTLYKLNNEGKEIAKMANQLGRIGSINANNSYKIFCFYPSAQQFTISDRFLSNTRTYDINDDNIGYASHACLSTGNMVWYFDNSNSELIQYNYATRTIISLTSTLQLIPDGRDISQILAVHDKVYLADQSSGVYIFDNLGNLKSIIEELGISQFSTNGDYLIHKTHDHTIHVHNHRTKQIEEIKVAQKKYFDSYLYKDQIFLISEKTVDIYHVKE